MKVFQTFLTTIRAILFAITGFEYEGSISESYDITYTYDDKQAPADIGMPLFFLPDLGFFLSGVNNCVKGTDRFGGYGFLSLLILIIHLTSL